MNYVNSLVLEDRQQFLSREAESTRVNRHASYTSTLVEISFCPRCFSGFHNKLGIGKGLEVLCTHQLWQRHNSIDDGTTNACDNHFRVRDSRQVLLCPQ